MKPNTAPSTLPSDSPLLGAALGDAAALIVALTCHDPATGSSRHSLAELDEVTLGRASRKRSIRGARRLALAIPDPRMSGCHARLVRELTRWIIEDTGAKNGVFVNGVRRQRAMLDDGDVIELGHTLCVFRATGGRSAHYPADCERGELASAAPGLATFVPSLAAAFDDLAVVARTGAPIVLFGETGTGKELVARAVHQLAGRVGAFVAVNCGALPETLAESELFGYRKGAFSGAAQDRAGLVRSADRGTLFLDEIGDLAPASQATLLRVLQEREVCPVGGTEAVPVDLRVVAASHHDLEALVAQGKFRRDLYARLAAFTLRIPPLRARVDDLGLLVADLLARDGYAAVRLAADAGGALLRYAWPSNIRELAACLVVATALARGEPVRIEHLPEAIRARRAEPAHTPDDEEVVPDNKRAALLALLTEHNGNVSAVARTSGRSRVQVHRWLRRFGLDAARFRR